MKARVFSNIRQRHLPRLRVHSVFLLTALLLQGVSNLLYGETPPEPRLHSWQAGINAGFLNNGVGPGIAFHYAFRPQKVLQTEAAISLDHQSGARFISGQRYRATALSVTAGLRLNLRPQRAWNPSLFLMPGLMLGSDDSDRYDDPGRRGIAPAAQLGLSNTFGRKHMVTTGFFGGEYLTGFSLKYGYWF